MSKVTFVFEYEEGKEPVIDAGTSLMGGKLISAGFSDYKDGFFTERQRDQIEAAIRDASWYGNLDSEEGQEIMKKLELLTQ